MALPTIIHGCPAITRQEGMKMSNPNYDHISGRRVGTNSKNKSNDIWTWTESGRETEERFRRDWVDFKGNQNRLKQLDRWEVKRNYVAAIDQRRWDRMNDDYNKELKTLHYKQNISKICCSSKQYDPISCQYANTPGGKLLQEKDANAKIRYQQRGEALYWKGSTYNPVIGVDIPRPAKEERNWRRRC